MEHQENWSNNLNQIIDIVTNIIHKFYTTKHLSEGGVKYKINAPINTRRIDFLIKEIMYGWETN